MKNLILGLVFLSLMACEKVITYDLPVKDPQLAVTTRIFTNDSLVATVSISHSSLSNKIEFSKDATVALYENGTMISELIAIDPGYSVRGAPFYFYISTYDCLPGRTYTIRASQSGYETVEGTTTIPNYAPILSNISTSSRDEFTDVTFDIKDQSGVENFYRVEIVCGDDPTSSFEGNEGFYSTDLTLEFYDDYDDFIDVDGEGSFGAKAYLRDRFFEGGTKSLTISRYAFFGGGNNCYVKVSSIPESTYDFERTLDIAYFSDEGPFSEPVSIISNMSNGQGGIAVEHPSFIKIPQ